MSDRQRLWIDGQRCAGCATCVEVCPIDAISIVNDKARIDDEMCTGCGACVDACPEGAIQHVIEGEIVPVRERPLPSVRPPSPVAEAAGAAVVATGTALLRNAAKALVQAVGEWLTDRSAARGPLPGRARDTGAEASAPAEGGGGVSGGHRARHRRRGR
jgi:Fe-S-cluster-containing hydrogenase component 2